MSEPVKQEYEGRIVVIKYGGNAMTERLLKESVAGDIVLLRRMGYRPVVVHGGGPAISEFMERLNITPIFVDGLRRTDSETFELVEMVLCGKVNKEIVKLINVQGGLAVGISGKDGKLLRGRKHLHRKRGGGEAGMLDLGQVGEVDHIDTTLLKHLLSEGYIPVIAPIGYGEGRTDYNINADVFAGDLAQALEAERLIYLTDVNGLMKDPGDSNSRIGRLTAREAADSMGEYASGGMVPKVESASRAVTGGVSTAHIVNGTIRHSILEVVSDSPWVGTTICIGGGDGNG
jgi:acetylglutamate kinase